MRHSCRSSLGLDALAVRSPSLLRLRTAPLMAIISPLAMALMGCADSSVAGAPPRTRVADDPLRPDVIIVAIEGLGFSDIGAFGGGYAETPAFDRLSEESVIYADTFAPSPWAGESLLALLTAKLPAVPPVSGETGAAAMAAVQARVGDDALPPTLAEHLEHLGYRTAIAFAHERHADACSPAAGSPEARGAKRDSGAETDPNGPVPSGFQAALSVAGQRTPDGARAEAVTSAALEWLAAADGPSLLVCSLADPRPPHYLYGGLVEAASAPYVGPVQSGMDHSELLRRAPEFTDGDRARLAEIHASEVALAEQAFDRIAGAATIRRGTAPILVLVGLRSPALGQREPLFGVLDEGQSAEPLPAQARRYGLIPSLSPDAIAVPLMIRFPSGPAGTERPTGLLRLPVSLLDVAPTLLDALGFKPRLDFDGRSVFPGAQVPDRDLIARTFRGIEGALAMRGNVAAVSIGAPGAAPRLYGRTSGEPWGATDASVPEAKRLGEIARTSRDQ